MWNLTYTNNNIELASYDIHHEHTSEQNMGEYNTNKQNNLYCNACRKKFGKKTNYDNHLNSKKHKRNLIKLEKGKQGKDKEAATTSSIQNSLYCYACRKKFGNQKTHDNHLSSKKHKRNLILAATDNGKFTLRNGARNEVIEAKHHDDYEDAEEEIVDSDEFEELQENPLTDRDCLFCVHKAEDIMDNLKHMSETHSFFIPDLEYCTDLHGLLKHLGEKVSINFICLWCNYKGRKFYSLDAVRKHMLDKCHCQMHHEGDAAAEYADYYDYSPMNRNHLFQLNLPPDDAVEYILSLIRYFVSYFL